MWLHGNLTARSMVPLEDGMVPYSSMQMRHRWSSFPSTPLPTRGSWLRNASAMADWVVEFEKLVFVRMKYRVIHSVKVGLGWEMNAI